MTLDNDKFFKENEMLRKNEQNLINQINNLNMQLKVKKDNNDKEMQQKIKEINEQKWFLENQQIAIQTEKQKLDKQRQDSVNNYKWKRKKLQIIKPINLNLTTIIIII